MKTEGLIRRRRERFSYHTMLCRMQAKQLSTHAKRFKAQGSSIDTLSERIDLEGETNNRQDEAQTEQESRILDLEARIAALETANGELWLALYAAHSQAANGSGTGTSSVANVVSTGAAHE